jgi:SAM-dependent methyltransferase
MPQSHNYAIQVVGGDLVPENREVWIPLEGGFDQKRPTPVTSASNEKDFRTEHGRRWHAFEEGQYWLPNDIIEINRLDLQHYIWKLSLNDHLHISPILDNVENVLDVGTGTGAWVIDFAKAHPAAQVLGTDLSPIQPKHDVPGNSKFIVHNAESDWNFEHKFDFIQGRMLLMGIHDWPAFFKKAWDNLEPGGWLEVSNPEYPVSCDDNTTNSNSPLFIWSQKIREAVGKDGIDTLMVLNYRAMLEKQGFINIREEQFKWPVGSWPKGKQEKNIGHWMILNVKAFVAAPAHALFTKKLDWSKEEVEKLVQEAMEDLDDTGKHYYWQM